MDSIGVQKSDFPRERASEKTRERDKNQEKEIRGLHHG